MDSCDNLTCPANREGECWNDWGCMGGSEEKKDQEKG